MTRTPNERRERRPGIGVTVPLLAALVFSGFTAVGADVAVRALRLQRAGAEAIADVSATGPGGYRGHWVRYHFTVNADPRTFAATEAFGLRSDVPVNVPPREWEQARNTGKIRVRYLLSDPRINLPADAPPFLQNPWVSGVSTAVLGLLGLVNWSAFVLALRRRRRDITPRSA